MNRRFFLAGVVMNSAKTVGQKWGGGSNLGEPRGPKSGRLGPTGPIAVYAYALLNCRDKYKRQVVRTGRGFQTNWGLAPNIFGNLAPSFAFCQ